MRHRPGPPRQRRRRIVGCRHRWVQLIVHVLRFGRPLPWCALALLRDVPQFQRRVPSRLRFSVALPLGINAPAGRFTASLYPTFELNPTIRRIARAEASPSGGPQLTLLWAPQASTLESTFPHSLPLFVAFVLGTPPRAGAFGHSDWAASTPIRGRRFLSESRYSLSVLAIRRQR